MRYILFEGFFFGKMWNNMEKQPFFRAAMTGLGKYSSGGYGRIRVYRDAILTSNQELLECHTDQPN